MRKILGLAALAAALACGGANAQQINVKIGVLTDMASLYADDTGPGSVVAAKMAAAGFHEGPSERQGRGRSAPTIRTRRTSACRPSTSGSTSTTST